MSASFFSNPSALGATAPQAPPRDPTSIDACGLAQRAGLGDNQAFEALMELFRRRLYAMLRSMVATSSDAEEVLQQALLQVHLGLPKLKPPKNDGMLSAWIFRVAVNVGLMHLRAKRRRPVLHLEDVAYQSLGRHSDGMWADAAPLNRPDDKLLHKEMSERLHLAIAALPDKYRLVLWLRDIEEQSNDEVASTLGLTVPTVKARLLRARAVVRGTLTQYVA